MARHRNVRGYNYDDDFDDDDMYSHSVEDDYGISPATAAQFIYSKRGRHQSFSEPLEEEEDEDDDKSRAPSTALSPIDQARLFSCLDQMREVLGESVSEQIMTDAVLQCGFDAAKALDQIFKQESNTKKSGTQEATASERKEALFTSLQHTSNNQPLSSIPKYSDSPELGFSNLANRQSLSNISSHDPLGSNGENILPDFTPTLSLSALINESSQQSSGGGNPVALSTMSLLDLMNPSPGTLSDLDLSEPTHCCKDVGQIPDLIRLGNFSTSVSKEKAKDMALGDLNSSQVVSFPRNAVPQNHILTEKVPLFGSLSSVLYSEDSMSSDGENLSVPKYGSPSLADLIQEHKERNPVQDLVLESPQKNWCNIDSQSASLVPLSQLSDGCNAAMDIQSLSTSLSSLAVSHNTDSSDFHISLSDLIAEASNKPHDELHNVFHSSGVTLTETDSNIDLRFLISEPLGGLITSDLNTQLPAHDLEEQKPSGDKCIRSVKVPASKNRKKPGHWVRSLKAKPSTFALSLCFTYIPKALRKPFSVNELPGCQNRESKLPDDLHEPEIIPFDFQTPSPDDLVKKSQKKAFMR
ncbi:HBS1-like protein isoform X3 [Engystomops pustulosus]|uniref:HBS1-like protein isoform X3 n=1 Tax=Engystomops pustulosus TaxID=76066 RepID=UPI003AFAA29E